MELRVLQYFLAVAKEQNISAAAQALHLTQPTLSRQLRDLEEELGKQLMIRGSRKITLTEEDLRPYFPDKRTTIPDAKRGVLEALDLRKKAIERQKAKAEAEKAGKGKKPPSPSR